MQTDFSPLAASPLGFMQRVARALPWARELPLEGPLLVVRDGLAADLPDGLLQGITWLDWSEPWPERPRGVVADAAAVGSEWVAAYVTPLGLPLIDAAELIEAYEGRIPVQRIDPAALMPRANAARDFAKRALDLGIGVLLLPPVLAISAVIAGLIRLDSPGPILFRQARVGRGGRPFEMLKFRTMRPAAPGDPACFTSDDDPRITRIGQLLRRTRLDELPQLWHVLRNEMSIVGPRPEQVPFVEAYERELPGYGLRHAVRPGITGWAQVTQGYTDDASGAALKLEYDLYYVRHQSLWLDLKILALTLPVLLTGNGAR
jgi:lipopolysaccharide/colanic/teichoic acid biosynthesis glycosyltransferase